MQMNLWSKKFLGCDLFQLYYIETPVQMPGEWDLVNLYFVH